MMVVTTIPLILVAILGFLSFGAVKDLEVNNRWVTHTYSVLEQAATIEKLVLDLETGERGFLITGNENFLEPYNLAKSELKEKINKLKETVSDNPPQVARLGEIEALIQQWLKEAGGVEIEARQQVKKGSKDLAYLQEEIRKEKGKKIFDQIRLILTRLDTLFKKSDNQTARILVAAIAKDLVDQETGQRGYLITGRDNFLEPYHQGLLSLKKNTAKLYNLIDNAYDIDLMESDLNTVMRLQEKWTREIAEARIDLKKHSEGDALKKSQIIALTKKGEGKKIIDEIRKVLNRMKNYFAKADNVQGEALLLAVSNSIVNSETGLRGFLITGDRKFLEPYYLGIVKFKENIFALKTLIDSSFNPHLARRLVKNVSELSESWESSVAKPEIAARKEVNITSTSMATVMSLVEKETGKEIIDKIRETIEEFKKIERNLMIKRQETAKSDTEKSNWTIVFGTLLVIFLSLFLSRIITRIIEGQIKQSASIAEKISEGNLDVEIDVQNEEDYLGVALKKMTNSLKKNTEELLGEKRKLENEDWIKGTQSEISKKLQKERSVKEFSVTLVKEICLAIDAQLGVLYSREESRDGEPNFKLLASFAYKKRKGCENRFGIGEGLVGQCALEKKPMIISSPPKDYIAVQSGSGSATPKNIMLVPIVIEGKVEMVIEIATLEKISKHHEIMIESLIKSTSVILSNLLSKIKTEDLLATSQALGEQMQEQQAELKATNEELESQASALKESEEKLRTQTEELQVINEELEEKTERLEQQKDELNKAKEDLEQRAKDLAMSSKYKSEFLANMSHELRTPLNSLLILSKKLAVNRDGNLTDKQVKSAEIINKGGHELLNLINDILDLSKVEAGKLQIEITPCRISKICNDLKNQFEPVAQEKGLEFEVNISRNLPQSIESDEQRIIQIIRNFMSNAFKFTESGKVGLSVAKAKLSSLPFELKDKKGDFIQFTVSDSGIGISKDKQRIIFEAFQQAEGSTSRKFGGTGLGLAISRAMTELLGGQITVDSEEGNGSIFSLILPLNIDVNQSRSAAKNKEVVIEYSKKHNVTPAKHSKTKRSKPKILIVEDDKDFIEIISDFSKEYGYLVYEATTGKEAIELAEEELPDAIILDLGLPDIDGIKVLEHLKDNLRTRDIPVHVISAREESEEIKARGAIGFLKKPATEETLADVFEQFKSAHQDEIKNVLVVEDNKSNQQAIYELIENEPINIHTVETGQAAIEYAKSNQIDCIILDLKLPDIPGLEVLKKLDKCLDKIPPVVIYTGRELTQEEDAELQKYSSSIVLKGGSSSNRLLDEVTLFLHSIEKEISVPSQKVVRMMHSGNEILKNKKVLLVDDDMRNVFALSSELEDCSLEVVIASNGEQAIRKLDEETNVDIVLMDIMMPVMDGNTAIEKIREDKRFEDLPIIALTAKAMAGDKEKCIKSGANDYIAKPIDVDQLISMIKVWLAK